MTVAFNKKKEQEKRRYLRKNMPKAEVLLWCKLKTNQILGKRFLRQYSVDQYVLDFYSPQLKLAIDIDGDSHFIPGAEEQDKARREHMEAFGSRFLRFTNDEIYINIDGIYQVVYTFVNEMRKR
jgi:very-short-patch-repair endonuclease